MRAGAREGRGQGQGRRRLTPEQEQLFLEAIEAGRNVSVACELAGLAHRRLVYRLAASRTADGRTFKRKWAAARLRRLQREASHL